jgi:DNA-binding transcriptional ArsR family regulator
LTPIELSVISRFLERIKDAIVRTITGQLACTAAFTLLPGLLHQLGQFPLMRMDGAIAALGALAQEHRLTLFRLLVQAGEVGMAAGAIAERLNVPNSSLSFHLAQLRNAGLITQERQHRSLIYRANYAAMNGLVDYLTENCCGGADCSPVPSTVEAPAAQITSERKSA